MKISFTDEEVKDIVAHYVRDMFHLQGSIIEVSGNSYHGLDCSAEVSENPNVEAGQAA